MKTILALLALTLSLNAGIGSTGQANHVINDSEAGYNQDAYDAEMDAA